MSKKQVVLFIVEGVSDETALAIPLEKLFSTEHIRFDITNGDITSDYPGRSIAAKIGECVKRHCDEYKYKREDFAEVVLLTDMDGTFVEAKSILKDESYERPYYNSCNILHKNPLMLHKSHSIKQQNLNRLISLPSVFRTIPFSVYFFSSNLDHVICNNANLPHKRKIIEAEKFRKIYYNDPSGFIAFFNSEDISVSESYVGSWNHIKEGANSLTRCSNLNVLLSPNAMRIARDFSKIVDNKSDGELK